MIHLAVQAAETGLDALPWGADAAMAVAFGAGVLLWLIGRKFIKPVFVLVSAALGGVLGFFGPPSLGLTMDPNVLLAVGIVAGGLAGLLMYRVAMAASFGMVLGALAPLTAAAVMHVQPTWLQENAKPLEQREMFLSDVPIRDDAHATSENENTTSENTPREALALNAAEVDAAVRTSAESVARFMRQLAGEVGRELDALPARQRLTLMGTAVLGGLMGFLAGFWWPKWVAAIGAAFVGAAIWLPAGGALIRGHDLPGAGWLPASPRAWMLTWIVVAVLGAALQWTALGPQADKAQSKSKD